MNTENIELVVYQIRMQLNKGDYRSAEEMVNIYRNLYDFHRDSGLIIEHLKTFTFLKNEIDNKLIIKALKQGNAKDAKTLTNIMRSLSVLIQEAERATKNTNTYKGKQLLNASKENGVLIGLFNNETNRGIGKSYELVKLAHQLDVTLITSNHEDKIYHENIARSLKIPVDIRYIKTPNEAKGIRFKNNKFIVDELVTLDIIMQLLHDGKELVGGFINLYTTHAAKKKEKSFVGHLQEKLTKVENDLWVMNKTNSYKPSNFSVEVSNTYINLLRKKEVLIELIEEAKGSITFNGNVEFTNTTQKEDN